SAVAGSAVSGAVAVTFLSSPQPGVIACGEGTRGVSPGKRGEAGAVAPCDSPPALERREEGRPGRWLSIPGGSGAALKNLHSLRVEIFAGGRRDLQSLRRCEPGQVQRISALPIGPAVSQPLVGDLPGTCHI